jgi:hypothetical protein
LLRAEFSYVGARCCGYFRGVAVKNKKNGVPAARALTHRRGFSHRFTTRSYTATSAMTDAGAHTPIVNLDEGWKEIKEKALDVLEKMIEQGVKNDKFFNPAECVFFFLLFVLLLLFSAFIRVHSLACIRWRAGDGPSVAFVRFIDHQRVIHAPKPRIQSSNRHITRPTPCPDVCCACLCVCVFFFFFFAAGCMRRYVATYTKCYDMCTQREPHSWSVQLYERHGSSLRHYLQTVALTAIVAQPESPPHVLLHECVFACSRARVFTCSSVRACASTIRE